MEKAECFECGEFFEVKGDEYLCYVCRGYREQDDETIPADFPEVDCRGNCFSDVDSGL